MLSITYGEAALIERTCHEWFQRFKSFEDSELGALLTEDSCQTQEELAESLGVTEQAISKRLKSEDFLMFLFILKLCPN